MYALSQGAPCNVTLQSIVTARGVCIRGQSYGCVAETLGASMWVRDAAAAARVCATANERAFVA